jgi:hypothetical protein
VGGRAGSGETPFGRVMPAPKRCGNPFSLGTCEQKARMFPHFLFILFCCVLIFVCFNCLSPSECTSFEQIDFDLLPNSSHTQCFAGWS